MTRYGVDGPGIESRWAVRLSEPVQTWSRAHPASWVPGLFPGVKWPGHGVDHPPLSSAEVKERVQLYLYSPFGTSWYVIGMTFIILLHLQHLMAGRIGNRAEGIICGFISGTSLASAWQE